MFFALEILGSGAFVGDDMRQKSPVSDGHCVAWQPVLDAKTKCFQKVLAHSQAAPFCCDGSLKISNSPKLLCSWWFSAFAGSKKRSSLCLWGLRGRYCPRHWPPWPPVPMTSLTWRCDAGSTPERPKENSCHRVGGPAPYTISNWPETYYLSSWDNHTAEYVQKANEILEKNGACEENCPLGESSASAGLGHFFINSIRLLGAFVAALLNPPETTLPWHYQANLQRKLTFTWLLIKILFPCCFLFCCNLPSL